MAGKGDCPLVDTIRTFSAGSQVRRPPPPAYRVSRPLGPEVVKFMRDLGLQAEGVEIGNLQRRAAAELSRASYSPGVNPWLRSRGAGLAASLRPAQLRSLRFGPGGLAQAAIQAGIEAAIDLDWSALRDSWSRFWLGDDFLPRNGMEFPPGWATPAFNPDTAIPADPSYPHQGDPDPAYFDQVLQVSKFLYATFASGFYYPESLQKHPPSSPVPTHQIISWATEVADETFYFNGRITATAEWLGDATPYADIAPTPAGPLLLPSGGGPGPFVHGWASSAQRVSNAWPQGYAAGYAMPEGQADLFRVDEQEAAERSDTPTRPKPGVHELKLTMRVYKKLVAVRVMEQLTEATDAVGAVFRALPKDVQRAVRQRWVERQFNMGVDRPAKSLPTLDKIDAIIAYRHLLDPEGIVRELLFETWSDAVIGTVGHTVSAAASNLIKRSGAIAPGVDHPLRPDLPLDQVAEIITRRRERYARQAATDQVRDFAIAEQRRRRAGWQGEATRRAAYRARHGGRTPWRTSHGSTR